MPLLSQNKNRIYLAYLRRGVVREGDVRYHTAFLVLPKKPDSEKRIGWRYYHVKNVILDNKECWQFFDDETLARTCNPIGLLLLGKIPLSIDYADLLEIFTKVRVVQGDPAWRCRHWAWDAIDHLVSKGVISLPPGTSAEEVWKAGYAFTESVDSEDLPKLDMPTCDILGNAIMSEVGPLQKE